MDNERLFNEIRAIIADVAEIDEEEISGESKFDDDLGVDSVKALEIMVAVEKKYKITFDESRLSDIIRELKTVNDAVALAKQLIEEKGA